ncbi:MAG: hypothetical protein EXS11_02100 [Gemmataceae bacterium]|nr:hypothetical protein [Gemmataceae bacterium]
MSKVTSSNQLIQRNIMFADQGLLLGFLNREMVLKAFNGWLLDKSLLLGEILVQQKSITLQECQQIEREQDDQAVSSDPNPCPLDTTKRPTKAGKIRATLPFLPWCCFN